jgi:hypothetical protein
MWMELFFDALSSPAIGLSPAADPPERDARELLAMVARWRDAVEPP